MGPGGTPLAEAWKRIVALLLDGIGLYLIVGLPVGFIIGGGGFTSVNTVGESLARSFFSGLITTVIYFLYYSLMIGSRGQTVAGMILKIKVVGTNGAPTTMADGFKRSAWTLLGIVTCIGGLAQFVLVIWGLVNLFNDPLRQTPWDKLADTVVVDA